MSTGDYISPFEACIASSALLPFYSQSYSATYLSLNAYFFIIAFEIW